jgi:adenylate kinase
MQIFVFLGAPGAGKGTVAGKIAQLTSARHISTGAMLRESVRNGTPAGLSAKAYMDKGALVPDKVLVDMIGELLASASADTVFLFDGFPRNESQASDLENLARKYKAEVKTAICLDVPENIVLRRLGGRRVCPACGMVFHVETLRPRQEGVCDACGAKLVTRADDQPETIKHRLEVYEEQTAPLIAWYGKAGKLRRVDGAGEAEATVNLVMDAMAK